LGPDGLAARYAAAPFAAVAGTGSLVIIAVPLTATRAIAARFIRPRRTVLVVIVSWFHLLLFPFFSRNNLNFLEYEGDGGKIVD
jgi:hypothetical protein